MKKYIARAVVTLPAGCVRLDAAQLRTRAHNLTALADGAHRIERPIQFKAGESFEWDGEVPKLRAGDFEPVSDGVQMEMAITEGAAQMKALKEAAPAAAEPRARARGKRFF